MPGRRASDSAMLVSGNLPMSSDDTASTIESELRLVAIEVSMLLRRPVTVTCSSCWVCCAKAAPAENSKTEQAIATGVRRVAADCPWRCLKLSIFKSFIVVPLNYRLNESRCKFCICLLQKLLF